MIEGLCAPERKSHMERFWTWVVVGGCVAGLFGAAKAEEKKDVAPAAREIRRVEVKGVLPAGRLVVEEVEAVEVLRGEGEGEGWMECCREVAQKARDNPGSRKAAGAVTTCCDQYFASWMNPKTGEVEDLATPCKMCAKTFAESGQKGCEKCDKGVRVKMERKPAASGASRVLAPE